jgi:hypothetical protein
MLSIQARLFHYFPSKIELDLRPWISTKNNDLQRLPLWEIKVSPKKFLTNNFNVLFIFMPLKFFKPINTRDVKLLENHVSCGNTYCVPLFTAARSGIAQLRFCFASIFTVSLNTDPNGRINWFRLPKSYFEDLRISCELVAL